MNILVVDSQQILNSKLNTLAVNRMYYSLIRFEHRINGATMHFSRDENSKRFRCTINASVEGAGIVSVTRSGSSAQQVMNLAVDAIEPVIAYQVDWRACFNADVFATWITSIGKSIRWPFRAKDRETATPSHVLPERVERWQQRKQTSLPLEPHIRIRTQRQANTLSN